MKDVRLEFALQRDTLLCDSGPYVHRWIVETPWGSVRLHKWVDNDDLRAAHDHPWPFYTLILWGGYIDLTTAGEHEGKPVYHGERLRAGNLRFRPALHEHTVFLTARPTWTLVLTGPKVRPFGFRVGKDWLRADRYFGKYGKAACS